eukprot:scaffold2204_cov166-Amphora_coffeaeformis.AAC.21
MKWIALTPTYRFSDRGGVHDWHEIDETLLHDAEKECLVPIAQALHVNVLVKGRLTVIEFVKAAFDLLILGGNVRREESVEFQQAAFLFGKGRSLVVTSVAQKRRSGEHASHVATSAMSVVR